jgi:hypothetical protein
VGDVKPWSLLQVKETPMAGPAQARRRGSYGIDAPYAAAAVTVVAVADLAIAIMNAITFGRVWPFLPALFLLAIIASCLYTTLRGKFLIWAELLDQLGLRGDERILDLGCGRGAVLLMAVSSALRWGQNRGVARGQGAR